MCSSRAITFCTPLKGRLHHLARTFPLNYQAALESGLEVQFVIVNHASPDALDAWAMAMLPPMVRAGNVRYYRLTAARPGYNIPAADNLAMRLARTRIVSNLMADNVLTPSYIREVVRLVGEKGDRRLIIAPGNADLSTMARHTLYKEDFEALGGYDEAMAGWGFADTDLVRRAKALGMTLAPWSVHHAIAIEHTNDARTAFSPVGLGPGQTNLQNKMRSDENLAAGRLIANQGRPWGLAQVENLTEQIKAQPPQAVSFEKFVPSRPNTARIAFGIAVGEESAEQLEWMLAGLRACYPLADVFAVQNRPEPEEAKEVLRRYGVKINDSLSTAEVVADPADAARWKSFFEIAAGFQLDVLVRLDAFARVCRQLGPLPKQDVFGAWQDDHVMRGVLGFSRNAVMRAAASSQAEAAAAVMPSFAAGGLKAWIGALNLTTGPWPELDAAAVAENRPFRRNAAITYPHRFQIDPPP